MVQTCVQLSEEDYNFCKKQNLSVTTLLRIAINEHKQLLAGVISSNVHEERRKKEVFMQKAQKLISFIEKKGLTEEYLQHGND